MKAKKEPMFKTEEELCAAFIEWAKKDWTCYPETAGWDILLVDKYGLQMGVQAKMRLNAEVLKQALPNDSYFGTAAGPDYRAVLVPEANGLLEIATILGFAVYVPMGPHYRPQGVIQFDRGMGRYGMHLHDWNPAERHKLPEFVPDVAAGVPSPIQLTPWKIGALHVLAEIEVNGSVDRKDIRGRGVDPRRWTSADNWLKPIGNGRYIRGAAPRFEDQHPDVYAQILDKLRKQKVAA